MRPSCAITGTRGFVGSRLADAMARAGFHVLRLQRRGTGEGVIPWSLEGGVEASRLQGMTTLIHGAWDMDEGRDPAREGVNRRGTEMLLAAARVAGVAQIIFISSTSAYDGCRTRYGRAKLECEELVARQGGMSVRPGLVYAPGAGGMVGTLRTLVNTMPVVPMPGGGGQEFVTCHVEDLCHAIISLVQQPLEYQPQARVAAHPQKVTLSRILRALAERAGRRRLFVPAPWRAPYLGLWAAERLGVRLPVRSDSLLSLMSLDPDPRINTRWLERGLFRPFPQGL